MGARFHSFANRIDHCAPASLQPVVRIGNPAPLLAVQKIEGDHVDTARRQSVGKAHDEVAGLTGTGSVSEDQCDTCSILRGSRISYRRYASLRRDLDAD